MIHSADQAITVREGSRTKILAAVLITFEVGFVVFLAWDEWQAMTFETGLGRTFMVYSGCVLCLSMACLFLREYTKSMTLRAGKVSYRHLFRSRPKTWQLEQLEAVRTVETQYGFFAPFEVFFVFEDGTEIDFSDTATNLRAFVDAVQQQGEARVDDEVIQR